VQGKQLLNFIVSGCSQWGCRSKSCEGVTFGPIFGLMPLTGSLGRGSIDFIFCATELENRMTNKSNSGKLLFCKSFAHASVGWPDFWVVLLWPARPSWAP